MTPEISVVVPTFNRRAMVREAVESVFAQRGLAFELIVVDDGSTDGTVEMLREIGERRIRIIRTGNRGPAAARNLGVETARAPMIAFLDSDDLWLTDKLVRQLRFMRDHPACTISQTQELWMRDGRRVNPGRRHLKRAGDIFIDSLRTCLISPSSVMMTTELFRSAGGFDATMAACEDYDLWLRILLNHEVALLDEPLTIRRAGHPGQLSATVPALDRFRILALAKLLGRDDLVQVRRGAIAEVIAEKCRIYAGGLARRERGSEAAFYERLADCAVAQWSKSPNPALADMIAEMRGFLGGIESSSAERHFFALADR